MSAPVAYLFDVFGTVVDWRNSVARVAGLTFEPMNIDADPHAFADFWRGRYQPAMERIRSGGRSYVPLDDLHFENLAETLNHFGLGGRFETAARWKLNRAWEHLDPWPDVVPGLLTLKRRAIIAPCSNGSISLMTRLAKHADLPWDCILGADIARDYKPRADVYLACCKALRLEPDEVMMVAAHNDDLAAAQATGLKTCFISRPSEYGPHQHTDLEPEGDWDLVVETFGQIAG